jgi:hypothetical protein|tara:strand:+ start:2637 stop:2822 length:186 start_codon:yes stop_codon:yes gene_type:complete
MDNRSINKFDLRLRGRFLKEQKITNDEIEKNDTSLEDQSNNMEEIVLTDDDSSEVDGQVAE